MLKYQIGISLLGFKDDLEAQERRTFFAFVLKTFVCLFFESSFGDFLSGEESWEEIDRPNKKETELIGVT